MLQQRIEEIQKISECEVKMKLLRVLSLFDGISSGQVALERAEIPVEVYYASEIDKYAIQVTQKNYPNTIQLGDVTKIDFTQFIGKIDLLIGGSPCQDLSIAGARKGLSGERSGLFYKFVEALKVIKPKYFLLENNASMSNDNKEIISELLGVEPIMINSALVSAQNRKRLYWTNIPNVEQPKDKNILLQDILEYEFTNRRKSKTVRIGGAKSGWGNKHEWDMPNKNRIYTTIELERLQTLPDNYTNFVPDRQRRKTIGNAWTVDVIAHIFKHILDTTKN